MNTLVTGNGFDIEHGLPTKYIDFLNYLSFARNIYSRFNGEDISEMDEAALKRNMFQLLISMKKNNEFNQTLENFY